MVSRAVDRRGRSRPAVQKLTGWGRFPVVDAQVVAATDLEAISRDAVLSRGLGRAYGDAALPPPSGGIVASTVLADRVLAFDPETGRLRAEAGLSLGRINRLFWPRGWCSPVSPGTSFVTLGGMVASDVHGKNHHEVGCFGQHVLGLRMRTGAGDLLELSEDRERELFRATLGGMGLTGHMLEVEVQLKRIPSPWIWRESIRVDSLDALIDRLVEAGASWPYTVCWMDATATGRQLGRGILGVGRWAQPDECGAARKRWSLQPTVPSACPGSLLSAPLVKAFNRCVWLAHGASRKRGIVDPSSFLHNLDGVRDWNRLYGAAGFTQYQCVIPSEDARKGIERILAELSAANLTSPIVVVKDCGPEGRGMLSYPRPGISIALDLPIRGGRTAETVHRLNRGVIELGGRVSLTKDTFTTGDEYRAMDPRVDAWLAVRQKWDPERRIRSALSVRLFGDPA